MKDIDDPDINDYFFGVFSPNHLNKFIEYKTMISEKREDIHLSLLTAKALIKMALSGGAFWTLNRG